MDGIRSEPTASARNGRGAQQAPPRTDFVAYLSESWGLPQKAVARTLAGWVAHYEPGPRALEMAQRDPSDAAA